MKNTHENVLERVDNTLAFYTANQTAIDTVAVLQTGFAALNDLYELITGKRPTIEMDITDYSGTRKRTLLESSEIAASCAAPLLAFARKNNLTDILSKVSSAATDYRSGRSQLIGSRYDELKTRYTEQLPNMTGYNVSQAKLDLLTATITDVKKVLKLTRGQIDTRKLTNEEVDEKITEIHALFRDVLNPNMRAFSLDNPALYAAYLQASRTVNSAATHTNGEGENGAQELSRSGLSKDAAKKEKKKKTKETNGTTQNGETGGLELNAPATTMPAAETGNTQETPVNTLPAGDGLELAEPKHKPQNGELQPAA